MLSKIGIPSRIAKKKDTETFPRAVWFLRSTNETEKPCFTVSHTVCWADFSCGTRFSTLALRKSSRDRSTK